MVQRQESFYLGWDTWGIRRFFSLMSVTILLFHSCLLTSVLVFFFCVKLHQEKFKWWQQQQKTCGLVIRYWNANILKLQKCSYATQQFHCNSSHSMNHISLWFVHSLSLCLKHLFWLNMISAKHIWKDTWTGDFGAQTYPVIEIWYSWEFFFIAMLNKIFNSASEKRKKTTVASSVCWCFSRTTRTSKEVLKPEFLFYGIHQQHIQALLWKEVTHHRFIFNIQCVHKTCY